MASRRPDLAQYPTGFTILRIFQAVLSVIAIVVTSFTIHAVVLPGNSLLIVAVCFSRSQHSRTLLTTSHLYRVH
jgi:hypothetical protein